jgi:Xaa-Pro aminopeptidase
MTKAALIQEKINQAVGILNELDIDAWMTFVRETSLNPDPCLALILGRDMVWESAFIITRDDRRIAIIGSHDAEMVRLSGGYPEIVPYVEDIREPLLNTLLAINPGSLALNYSENDVAADGLSHGLMLLLQQYLSETGLMQRAVSAERLVAALRGRKSPMEVERIRQAIQTTQLIFERVGGFARRDVDEVQIADTIHQLVTERGLTTSWEWEGCPNVSAGPDSPVGHGGPQAQYHLTPGTLLHIDFGIRENDYCSDLQRVWYVRRDEEDSPPPELRQAFQSAREALMAGFAALQPGVQGWEVDAVARRTLVEAGYPEYQHAFGHHLGRAAHDGATVLGPRWARYGQTPYGLVEAGNVFAIELGVAVPGMGYVGLEENVLVSERGPEWLSDPQTDLWLI